MAIETDASLRYGNSSDALATPSPSISSSVLSPIPSASVSTDSEASESVDTDADGIGDNTDDDIDGDGVANASDEFPYLSDASVSIAIEASDLDGGFSNRFVLIPTELSAVDELINCT